MEPKIALSIGAHPDDAEFFCAGTLALLAARGWQVHIATMTPGDCGTVQYSREEISRIRKNEAVRSAALIGAQYHCLECDDIFILYDRPTLMKVIELVRQIRPNIVFTLCEDDYMVDHTTTGKLAMTGCFCSGIVNIVTSDAKPFEATPALYYMDPVEAKDRYGKPIRPGMIVDIGETFETKIEMLSCHASQRDWLLKHHGIDEYTKAMEHLSLKRGKEAGVRYGEAFRQHLGHAYPQDNRLAAELGNLVHIL
ncbi:MAG: PIG-L family deacetylase [Sedimentisphaerales bacterium]|nr:PIG-L family deacetylase [Sedimentisphaerales bacterium]